MTLQWAWNSPERAEDAHIWFCIYIVIGISGILTNILVLIVFFHVKTNTNDRNSITTSLIIHQSVIDLTSSALFMFFYAIPEGWLIITGGTIFCKIRCTFWILAGASTVNIVFIALERYFAIVHPIKYHVRFKGKQTVYLVLPLAYIYGIVNLGHIGFIADINEHYYCDYYWNGDVIQMVCGIQVFLTLMVIPTIIIIFTYGSRPIIHTFYRRKERFPRCYNNHRYAVQKNIIVTFVIVSIAYFICWFPDLTVYLIHNVTGGEKPSMTNGNLHRFTVLLCASNMLINPFIYAAKCRQFREGFVRIYKKHMGKSRPRSANGSIESGIISTKM
ncbi:QRFP-like peptide receptor [Antedon mediterranea]|uniref:QRFP-like peptide receptor n=1 Tax=Antedon mediterranea TaxID=105859 RepID=UPI003AF67EE3